MENSLSISDYFEQKLSKNREIAPYLDKATVLWTENDPKLIWDIMVFLPDELFDKFASQYGDCFVVNDHKHSPWVFSRIKSFSWLKKDFSNRLTIALFIYQNSFVLQDKTGKFAEILKKQQQLFDEELPSLLKRKYVEFRTERHNLRHSLEHKNMVAIDLIKTTVIKLAIEMSFLAEKKPYPYKKWLPVVAQKETAYGRELCQISEDFLVEKEPVSTIEISDRLVAKVSKILAKTNLFPDKLFQEWWMFLS